MLLDAYTRRADWFFAYTPSAAKHVVDHGLSASRVTTFMNTLDTGTLIAERDAVDQNAIREFRRELGIGDGPILLFMGALKPLKRVDLVIQAADVAVGSVPDLNVVIAGRGSLTSFVDEAAHERGYLISTGPLFGTNKAVAMVAASALIVPGALGWSQSTVWYLASRSSQLRNRLTHQSSIISRLTRLAWSLYRTASQLVPRSHSC